MSEDAGHTLLTTSSDGASQLFTLRLWTEEGSEGSLEWRGKLQHVLSGEARYFHDWPALVDTLMGILSPVERASDE